MSHYPILTPNLTYSEARFWGMKSDNAGEKSRALSGTDLEDLAPPLGRWAGTVQCPGKHKVKDIKRSRRSGKMLQTSTMYLTTELRKQPCRRSYPNLLCRWPGLCSALVEYGKTKKAGLVFYSLRGATAQGSPLNPVGTQ